MATGACEKQNLLAVFADNDVQAITAADLRLLVNCIYDNFLDISFIIDNLETYEPKLALSANQGAILNDLIETNLQSINDLQSTKVDETNVYTKVESDSRYYTQTYIDSYIYTKQDVYNKQEISDKLNTLQDSINALNSRIDCIVQQNNLIDC